MYPTLCLLVSSQNKLWPARHTLRWTILVFLFVCSCIELTAQEYFYYYKGKRQPLKLNTEFVYVVTSSELSDSQKLSTSLDKDAVVSKFSSNTTKQTLKRIAPDAAQLYWAEVQLRSKPAREAYDNFVRSV